MSTLNIPIQLNAGQSAPTTLYPRELFVQYNSNNIPVNLWIGPNATKNTNADQKKGTPQKIVVSSSNSANSFKNGDTFLSNNSYSSDSSGGASGNITRLGNFNVVNQGTSTNRKYKWTTIVSGSVDSTSIQEATTSTNIDNYNTFQYININQLGRLVAKRNGAVFGSAFPSNPSDGQVFFKIVT